MRFHSLELDSTSKGEYTHTLNQKTIKYDKIDVGIVIIYEFLNIFTLNCVPHIVGFTIIQPK